MNGEGKVMYCVNRDAMEKQNLEMLRRATELHRLDKTSNEKELQVVVVRRKGLAENYQAMKGNCDVRKRIVTE